MPAGVLVAVGAAPFEARLLEAAEEAGLHVVRRCVDVADLLATAAGGTAEVAVVSAQLRGLDSTVVDQLRREGLGVLGVTVDDASADEALLRSLGVPVVVDAAQLATLRELAAEVTTDIGSREPRRSGVGDSDTTNPAAADVARAPGRIFAVWGPTGAPGRSTLAVSLAAELAGSGKRTLLIDADVYGGAVAAMLGMLEESSGLLAAARAANRGSLDPSTLVAAARSVHPMLRVLTGLPRADRWVELGSVLVRRVLQTATRIADVTVVDCGFSLEVDEELSYDTAAPRRNGATVEILAAADVVVVVGAADPIGVGRLIRALHELKETAPAVAPYVVVNRCRTGLGWPDSDIVEMVRRATGAGFVTTLPSDPAACDRALVHGKTLSECAPDSRLTKGVRRVAAELVGDQQRPRRVRTRRGARAR